MRTRLDLGGNGLTALSGLLDDSLVSETVVARLSRVGRGRAPGLVVVAGRARTTTEANAATTANAATDKLVNKQGHGEQEEDPIHVKECNSSSILTTEAVLMASATIVGQSSRSRQV